MGAPQIITICLYVFTCTMDLYKHGEPRKDKTNFFTTILGVALSAALLYWGGFWTTPN